MFLLTFAQKSTAYALLLFSAVLVYNKFSTSDLLVAAGTASLLFIFMIVIVLMSDLVTTKASHVAMKIYETQWYCAPIKQQKIIQMVIKFSQRVQHFHGGKTMKINLPKFANVCHFIN